MIKEKIETLVAKIKMNNDEGIERKLSYVQGVVDAATDYVRAIITMETRIKILQFRLDPEDYRSAVEQMDRARRSAHDSFIAKLTVVNRLCSQLEIDPVYDGPDYREDKGEFAFTIVEEFKINVRG